MVHRINQKTRTGILVIAFAALVVGVWWYGFQGKAAKPVTLVVWQTETDQAAVAELKQTIAEFEKDHPGVEVVLESIAWNSLLDKLEGSLAAHSEPDVAHLEPFMVSSLIQRNLLLPLDDVIQTVEKENSVHILESVRDLWLYDGRRYGIAHAIGTTGFAYRRDWAAKLQLEEPQTWSEYVTFAKAMHDGSKGKLTVLLPGGDRFFIDQLFAELVANNGGKLFDAATNRPLLNEKPVVETLEFLRDLRPYIDPGWTSQRYLDQFHRFGRGSAGNVPVAYARATKAIQTAFDPQAELNATATPDADHFGLMAQPVGPSHVGPSIATIDCEPFVVFKSSDQRPAGRYGNKGDLARRFLQYFYQKQRYLRFVKTVPIHLTPIFTEMASDPEYSELPEMKRWKSWADHTSLFLSDPNRVRPILMPDISADGRRLPFLLELHKEKILTQAVTDVLVNGLSAAEAAKRAQERAEKLVARFDAVHKAN